MKVEPWQGQRNQPCLSAPVVTSGQTKLDQARQRRTSAGEVEDVDVATHGVHWCNLPQRLQRPRLVDVAGVQNDINAIQGIKHDLWQPCHTVRDVGVGQQSRRK